MKVYQNSSFHMGTRFNILLPGIDTMEGNKLFKSCTHELLRLENMLSCYIEDSEISKLNRLAFESAQKVNSELFKILEDCEKYARSTMGAFDIGLGQMIDNWKENALSSVDEPDHYRPGSDKIILNSEDENVAFYTPSVKINLGGYGKGYALSSVRKLLISFGITSAFISFGESSISCIGVHPYGDFWQFGVMDQYEVERSIEIIKLNDESISTSGNLSDPNHILDPLTGKPVIGEKTITVKSADAIISEVLSTALMIADEKQKANILQDFPDIEVVEVIYLNKQAEVVKYSNIS